jgi:hypothetical protein
VNEIHKEQLELMDDYFRNVTPEEFIKDYLEIETFEGLTIDEFLSQQPVLMGGLGVGVGRRLMVQTMPHDPSPFIKSLSMETHSLRVDCNARPNTPCRLENGEKDLSFEADVGGEMSTTNLSTPLALASELGLDNEHIGRFNQLSARAKRCGVSEEMLMNVLDLFVKEVEQSFECGQAAG